jgi:hypothetical protein
VVGIATAASHLKFRRNCVHADEISGDQHARHNEYPVLVMRHGDQPGNFRENRGNGCPKPSA